MANKKITELDPLTSGSVDRATDVLEIADVSASQSKKITPNALMGISGAAVGDTDTQTLSNKTITTPAISSPVLSGTVSGTYTLGGTPTFPSSVVTLTGSQTLTNKVLTSPTINMATISNPTLTVDTVSEHTAANGVTVDGLNIRDSKLNTNNSVVTSNITDDAVTAAKIDWASTGANGGIWWEELGRTTLASAGDTITVSGIPARKYLKIFVSALATGGTIRAAVTFNNDTGNNYASRLSSNGAADATTTSAGVLQLDTNAIAQDVYAEIFVVNIAAQEKIPIWHSGERGAAGAANAPNRREGTGKWANTSSQITRVDVTQNLGSGDFAIGSEVIVLGHD